MLLSLVGIVTKNALDSSGLGNEIDVSVLIDADLETTPTEEAC